MSGTVTTKNPRLSDSARRVLNDPELISIRDGWFARLRRLFDGADDARTVFAVDGVNGCAGSPSLLYCEPERWVAECLENLAEHAGQAKNTYIFTPLCIQSDIYGVHFVDSIFGCKVYFKYGQWYNEYLSREVGDLTPPDIDKSEAWRLTLRVAKAFVNADAKLPVFGMPTIASALNIAVNLYGERILASMLCEPEAAAHDLRIINDTLMGLHRRMAGLISANQLQPVVPCGRIQPPGFGQICGCTTQLISRACYRDMIAPLDSELLGVYPEGGMIHLCGAHEHQINIFREMSPLRAVQLNDRAAGHLADYHAGLRPDQIIYLNPCDDMPAVKAVDITGGKRLVLVGRYRENKR